jgi:hypothetical protein
MNPIVPLQSMYVSSSYDMCASSSSYDNLKRMNESDSAASEHEGVEKERAEEDTYMS